MKKPFIIVLLLLASLVFSVATVSAVAYCGNVSFSTLGQSGAEDILIYTPVGANQTLLGMYNTSSPYVLFPCGDVNVVVRPSAIGRLTNPVTMLTDGFSWVETYWLQILVVLALAGVGWGTLRMK